MLEGGQQRHRRRPQAHLSDGLLVCQHWLRWSSLCRSLYMVWILPALLTHSGGGQKKGNPQSTSCAPPGCLYPAEKENQKSPEAGLQVSLAWRGTTQQSPHSKGPPPTEGLTSVSQACARCLPWEYA